MIKIEYDVIVQNVENVNHFTGVQCIPTHVHVLCNYYYYYYLYLYFSMNKFISISIRHTRYTLTFQVASPVRW